MRKLQVWRTIKDANVFIYAHKDFFWRLAILPMCTYFAAYFVYFITVGKGLPTSMTVGEIINHTKSGAEAFGYFPIIIFFVLFMILPLLLTPFIVTWHRLVLLGLEAVNSKNSLKYSRREWMFYLMGFVLSLILNATFFLFWGLFTGIFLLIGPLINVPMNSAGSIIAVLFFMMAAMIIAAPCLRFLLVQPSISIDRRASLGAAWKLGKNNSYRLTMIIIIASLPTLIGYTIITKIIFFALTFISNMKMMGVFSVIAANAIDLVFFFTGSAVIATTLSLCYRELTEAQAPTKNPLT